MHFKCILQNFELFFGLIALQNRSLHVSYFSKLKLFTLQLCFSMRKMKRTALRLRFSLKKLNHMLWIFSKRKRAFWNRKQCFKRADLHFISVHLPIPAYNWHDQLSIDSNLTLATRFFLTPFLLQIRLTSLKILYRLYFHWLYIDCIDCILQLFSWQLDYCIAYF